jgi:hypothetical protein
MVAAVSGTNPDVPSGGEEQAVDRAEEEAERAAVLRMRRQCRHRHRFVARRLALVRQWEYMHVRLRVVIATEPGRISVTPLWWVQYLAMLGFAFTVTSKSTIISGGNLLLLLVYLCSVEARNGFWWYGATYTGLSLALQVCVTVMLL